MGLWSSGGESSGLSGQSLLPPHLPPPTPQDMGTVVAPSHVSQEQAGKALQKRRLPGPLRGREKSPRKPAAPLLSPGSAHGPLTRPHWGTPGEVGPGGLARSSSVLAALCPHSGCTPAPLLSVSGVHPGPQKPERPQSLWGSSRIRGGAVPLLPHAGPGQLSAQSVCFAFPLHLPAPGLLGCVWFSFAQPSRCPVQRRVSL